MMVAEKLTVAELAVGLTDVLERVRVGEQFAIERDGEVIAVISSPLTTPEIAWDEFVAGYRKRIKPDNRFSDEEESGCNPPHHKPGITVADLVARVGNLQMPGDGFADDLEAIQAAQGVAEMPEWPD